MNTLLIIVLAIVSLILSFVIAVFAGKIVANCNGITLKKLTSLIELLKIRNIAFDKKLVSRGESFVTDILPADYFSGSGYSLDMLSDEALLETAVLLAKKVDNPVATAIRRYADELIIEAEDELSDFVFFPKEGGQGTLNDVVYRGGTLDFIKKFVTVPEEISERAAVLSNSGKACVYFSKGKKLLGIIAITDTIKNDMAEIIAKLKEQKLHAVMLANDTDPTAGATARMAGADEVRFCNDEDSKKSVLKELRNKVGTAYLMNNGIQLNEGVEADMDFKDVSKVVTAFKLSKAICGILILGVCIVAVFTVLGILFDSWMIGVIGFLLLIANAIRIFLFKVDKEKKD